MQKKKYTFKRKIEKIEIKNVYHGMTMCKYMIV